MTAFDGSGSDVWVYFDGDRPSPGAIAVSLSDELAEGVATLTVDEAKVVLLDLVNAINIRAGDIDSQSEVLVIQSVNRQAWEALISTT